MVNNPQSFGGKIDVLATVPISGIVKVPMFALTS